MHPGRWSAPWEPSGIISFPRDPCITAAPCRLPLALDGDLKWTLFENRCSLIRLKGFTGSWDGGGGERERGRPRDGGEWLPSEEAREVCRKRGRDWWPLWWKSPAVSSLMKLVFVFSSQVLFQAVEILLIDFFLVFSLLPSLLCALWCRRSFSSPSALFLYLSILFTVLL